MKQRNAPSHRHKGGTRHLLLFALHLSLGTSVAAQQRIAVHTEPGTPVIATELLIATGPADEAEGEAGLAHLAARSVVAPIRPVLDSLGVRLSLEAHKDALSFSLIAAPDVWEEATRRLFVALFRDPVDSLAVLRERRDIRAELLARQTNPADVVALEADAAFFGAGHPWGRAAVGTSESVARLTVGAVDRYLRTNFLPERSVVAVVGPAEETRAQEHLVAYLGGAGVFPHPPPTEPADTAVRREYNTVTTWISVSYGFPSGADVDALRLIAHLATESLAFGPSQRSVYNVRSEVTPRLGGGEIRFQVVIPPQEAGEWAARIEEAVAGTVGPMPDDVFAAWLRRYRGERLMALAAPEDRAREQARRLMLTGRPEIIPSDEVFTPERLREAARSLGPPTLVFVGPYFGDRTRSAAKGAR